MIDLPESLFANPVWHALQTAHRRFAISAPNACRYPADIAPFAAVAEPSEKALRHLGSLLAPDESVWLFGEAFPQVPELAFRETLRCLQMVLPEQVPPFGSAAEIVPLSDRNAQEMVALTDLAFPGFFRRRTCEMGEYFGVRHRGELIAMAGERLILHGHYEISGVCTHPEHRGRGLAANLIGHLAQNHRREGHISWLTVAAANQRAIQLYRRLGFVAARQVTLTRVFPTSVALSPAQGSAFTGPRSSGT